MKVDMTIIERGQDAITSFSGRNRFLSNFYEADVVLDGVGFPTVEHAYQAAKTENFKLRMRIRRVEKPAHAKAMGRDLKLLPDWDTKLKIPVMRDLLMQKFSRKPLSLWLAATGGRELIEGNTWGDTFWGECPLGNGENNLGILLMEVREEMLINGISAEVRS